MKEDKYSASKLEAAHTLACPCGYGIISARFFKKRDDKSFRKVFKQNLGIVFPIWFVPFALAIYLLVTRYTDEIFILTIAFSLIGFVVIPLISKFVGCKNCEIKEDCPWMKVNKKIPSRSAGQALKGVLKIFSAFSVPLRGIGG